VTAHYLETVHFVARAQLTDCLSLQRNHTVGTLQLSGNDIGPIGIQHLAEVLVESVSIASLVGSVYPPIHCDYVNLEYLKNNYYIFVLHCLSNNIIHNMRSHYYRCGSLLKFTVNFKDVFQVWNFTVNFKYRLQIRVGATRIRVCVLWQFGELELCLNIYEMSLCTTTSSWIISALKEVTDYNNCGAFNFRIYRTIISAPKGWLLLPTCWEGTDMWPVWIWQGTASVRTMPPTSQMLFL
jgi:hypothetical protein